MLAVEDIRFYSQHILFPENSPVQEMVDKIGNLTLKEIKTEYFDRAFSLLRDISTAVPWLTYQKQLTSLSLGSKGVIFNMQVGTREDEIAFSGDDVGRKFDWSHLPKIEKDVNYLITLTVGRLGLAPQNLKREERLEIRKERIFARGFSEHFNQSFLASMGVKEVPRMDILVQEESNRGKEDVVYSLVKGEKNDLVIINAKGEGFSPLSLAELMASRIDKANDILKKVGNAN
jgi:hypothetical protein